MNTITINAADLVKAKELLSRAYEADKSATFSGEYHVNGSVINAEAAKTETGYDVTFNSNYYTVASLKQMFA